MTAQIDDLFTYMGEPYALAGISEGELFEPSLLDIKPVGMCTACYRGYQAVFAIVDSRLVLDTLHASLFTDDEQPRDIKGPTINGVNPTGPEAEHDWFNNHYMNLNYHLEYSGGLLLAAGFIDELYVHMGFHPAWKYKRVLELIFKNGLLVQESDRSAQMAELRSRMKDARDGEGANGMPSREEIERFVDRAFDRRYRF